MGDDPHTRIGRRLHSELTSGFSKWGFIVSCKISCQVYKSCSCGRSGRDSLSLIQLTLISVYCQVSCQVCKRFSCGRSDRESLSLRQLAPIAPPNAPRSPLPSSKVSQQQTIYVFPRRRGMAHGDATQSKGTDRAEPAWSLSPRDAASMSTSPAASPRGLCATEKSHLGLGAASSQTPPVMRSGEHESPDTETPPLTKPLAVPTTNHPASRFWSQFPQLAQPKPLTLEPIFNGDADTPVIAVAPPRLTAKKEELPPPTSSSDSHGLVEAKLEDQVADSGPGQRLLVSTG